MGDMRELQPESRILDFTRETKGNFKFECVVVAYPYSGIDMGKVFSREVKILCMADNAQSAINFAQCISCTISMMHDVWQTNIWSVSKVHP